MQSTNRFDSWAVERSRNGIVPMAAKGAATSQPFERKPSSIEDPVLVDGFLAIMGTRRMKTTRRHREGSEGGPVEPNAEQRDGLHRPVPRQLFKRWPPIAESTPLEQRLHCLSQVGERRRRSLVLGNKKHVPSLIDRMASSDLPKPPFHPVPHHRLADPTAHHESESRGLAVVGKRSQDQERMRPPPPLSLYQGELSLSPEPPLLLHPC